MAFWNRKSKEQRATSGLANPQGFMLDAFGTSPSPSGQKVTVHKALGIAPVWAAVSIISEQVGQLPLKVYKKLDGDDRVEATSHRSFSMLHDKPNEFTPADRFWSTVTTQLLLWGNVFVLKERDPTTGVVEELYLLEPSRVTVEWNREARVKRFIYEDPQDPVKRIYNTDDVLHIFGLSLDGVIGQSVVDRCKAALGAALGRDEFEGGFYARGATISGAIKHPNALSDTAKKHLSESFDVLYGGAKAAKRHGVPVFEEGSEFIPIGSTIKDMDLVALQGLTRTDVAVMFKLPPNYLGGSSGDSLTYSTVEMNQLHFALHAIAPVTNTIAKALSNDPGVLPQGVHYAEFTLEAMLRANANERADFYTKLVDMKAMLPDEVRQRENLPALTRAQKDELNPPAPPQLQLPVDQAEPVDASAPSAT